MRRIHAFIAIVALLTVPLAPIAWGMACEASSAPMMCCLPHGSHSQQGKLMMCHCPGKSGNRLPNVGLIAPIPPATPAALVRIYAPEDTRRIFFAFSQSIAAGFVPAPFEPPRA
ncbi:MAG TPA: hypothetical protein VNV41_03695 [Candidatus Acidoferrales bacterium]|jgi:hypothetical protein|nr:hypothetical protein [Candidatus Acidoferrales bacterium]